MNLCERKLKLPEQEIEKTAEKLVYISMGTVNNNMLDFYKNCICAFANTKYQVIISGGNLVSIESLGKLPSNIKIYAQVDQIAVLKKADAFISHCGMNSANESLYFGVPLVMFPQTNKQGGVSVRVFELGAGTMLKNQIPAAILSAVETVLENKQYKENANKISAGFKCCGGAKTAADKILSCCRNE